MNYKPETLQQGKFYHVYNRGNNRENLFFETADYYHFLRLYERYISPIADTYAWCMLKNHFHALVYIKHSDEIKINTLSYTTVETPKIINASRQFSHFFNAYTQSINKKYERTGSLFENPFRRKRVTSETFFKNLIAYIHNNPVHHGFVEKAIEYPWSSYDPILSQKPVKLNNRLKSSAFDDKESMSDFKKQQEDFGEIITFIIE